MILTPACDGRFYYRDVPVVRYSSQIDSRLRIVEEIITEELERFVFIYEWEDLNDIEKEILRERGQDIPSWREERSEEEDLLNHEAEIIPFPRSS